MSNLAWPLLIEEELKEESKRGEASLIKTPPSLL